MTVRNRKSTRRQYFAGAVVSLACGTTAQDFGGGSEKPEKRKTVLAFYCDDTDLHAAGGSWIACDAGRKWIVLTGEGRVVPTHRQDASMANIARMDRVRTG
jgi:hypothetical protein